LILLDTQVLVWFAEGDERLRAAAKKTIGREATEGGVALSPISFWEVVMLIEKERLSLGREVRAWTEAILTQAAIRLEPISPSIAIDAGRLPGGFHGDPADRIIVATARHLGCPLLTTDRKIIAYAEAGHVQAIDARR
jgi:PIN domain nuclease of toxin-antitoxin system